MQLREHARTHTLNSALAQRGECERAERQRNERNQSRRRRRRRRRPQPTVLVYCAPLRTYVTNSLISGDSKVLVKYSEFVLELFHDDFDGIMVGGRGATASAVVVDAGADADATGGVGAVAAVKLSR